jgi:hypothetical protein
MEMPRELSRNAQCMSVDRAWLAGIVLAATGPKSTLQERQAAKAAAVNLFAHGMRDESLVLELLRRPE